MAISAQQVKELRDLTGAGVLECRKALEENSGDLEKAVAWLRERGLAAAAKKSGREARDGMIEVYSHGNGRVGVMVEVNCETDFVARTEQFRTFVHDLALHIAAASPRYLDVADVPAEVLTNEAEGSPEKYYQEACLLRQPFVKDESLTIADLLKQTISTIGENIIIRRFTRWELSEAG
jgi:elongation factor Ts